MNQSVPTWAMLIAPVAILLGTMLIVMLGVYLQNRASERVGDKLSAQIDALRAEFRQQLAEIEVRITKLLLELSQRLRRLEESRGLTRTP